MAFRENTFMSIHSKTWNTCEYMNDVAVDPTEDAQEPFELTISFTEKEWEQIKSTLEKYDHKDMAKDEIMDRLKFWACKSIDSNIRSLNTPIGYNS